MLGIPVVVDDDTLFACRPRKIVKTILIWREMSKKNVIAKIRLVIEAGQAKPAPPVGPALGQAGLKIMDFCKDFNAKTADYKVRYVLCYCCSRWNIVIG